MTTASSHLHPPADVATGWHRTAPSRAPRPRARHLALRSTGVRRRPERLHPTDPLGRPSEMVVRPLGLHDFRC